MSLPIITLQHPVIHLWHLFSNASSQMHHRSCLNFLELSDDLSRYLPFLPLLAYTSPFLLPGLPRTCWFISQNHICLMALCKFQAYRVNILLGERKPQFESRQPKEQKIKQEFWFLTAWHCPIHWDVSFLLMATWEVTWSLLTYLSVITA